MELHSVAELLKVRPSCEAPPNLSAKLEQMKEQLAKMRAMNEPKSKKRGLGKGKRTRHL